MLRCLEVHDLALIRDLRLDAEEGLTVISGETGAGKSIIIDALSLVVGQRARREFIRQGAERCLVEACFDGVANFLPEELSERLLSEDEISEGQLILSREVDENGRSLARVNGRLCSVGQLREVGEALIAIHGQNDQQTIFDPRTHLSLLDRYAGEAMAELLAEWRELRKERAALALDLKSLGLNPAERNRRLDLLDHQIEELEEADFKEGEAELLHEKARRLTAIKRMEADLSTALSLLNPDEDVSALSFLQRAATVLQYGSRFDKELAALQEALIDVSERCQEIAVQLRTLGESLAENGSEAEKIYRRLDLWDRLSSKYGPGFEEMERFLEKAYLEREQLRGGESRFAELRKILKEGEKKGERLCDEMRTLRTAAAGRLEAAITNELSRLKMPGAQFKIEIESLPAGASGSWSLSGRERAEFFICPNLGEGFKELAKIASGGEASRIMLAIKSILADCDDLALLIFDEIDSGIGGEAAGSVADCLKRLSRGRQVFCVTHTAQLAACADQHYLVSKESLGERTTTSLNKLDEAGRIQEIARLLSGKPEDVNSLTLARTLLMGSV